MNTMALTASPDLLEQVGISPAGARILRYFLVRPDARPRSRELQRTLQLGGASLQRELERMEAIGALRRVEEGRRVRYEVVLLSPVWEAIGILAKASSDPSALIRDALIDMGGLHAAFIFGSTARGTQREDSDIDLFLVEDARIDRKRLLRQLAEVEMLLWRDVNAVRYTPEALAERLGDPRHPAWRFVRDVLTGPKRWVAGSSSAIAPLAVAAGLGAVDLAGSTA